MISHIKYGTGPDQVADLYLPKGGQPPYATVVMIHGGFWQDQYKRDLMDDLSEDTARRGWAVYNIEYRRIGRSGGGYPNTFLDVAAAIDSLNKIDEVDKSKVIVAGHSAGGHLALWVAGRVNLKPGQPGANPVVKPCAVVSLSGVADLKFSSIRGIGPVNELMGGTVEQVPDHYEVGSPAELVPFGIPILIDSPLGDVVVPPKVGARFARVAREAGDTVTEISTDGDHYSLIDPKHEAWTKAVDWIEANCPSKN